MQIWVGREFISPHPVHLPVIQPWTSEPVKRRNVTREGNYSVVREGRPEPGRIPHGAQAGKAQGTKAWPSGTGPSLPESLEINPKGGGSGRNRLEMTQTGKSYLNSL